MTDDAVKGMGCLLVVAIFALVVLLLTGATSQLLAVFEVPSL
jgi:hypothetical protein